MTTHPPTLTHLPQRLSPPVAIPQALHPRLHQLPHCHASSRQLGQLVLRSTDDLGARVPHAQRITLLET